MNKIAYLMTLAALICAGCELDTSDSGRFEGLWKMQGVDSLANGKHVDMTQSQVAYAFQSKLLQLRGGGASVFCRFEQKGDSLILSDPRKAGSNNPPVESLDVLRPYGFTAFRMPFHIDLLNGKRMILSSDEVRLHFDKY